MGLYNFKPSVRPVPMQVHIAGFPGKFYCPRMATMNKPTFLGTLGDTVSLDSFACRVCTIAIKQHSPTKPALVFVSSRRQTRLTALDLISLLSNEFNQQMWMHMSEDEVS